MSEVLGQQVQRVDAQEKVTGRGVYAGDIKLPGMLYGKVLRSPLPHTRVRRIDPRKAIELPGVVAVLTRDNMPVAFPYSGSYAKDQPIVAIEKVRYEGDVVAGVAATEEGIADEALNLVKVDYEELVGVYTVEDALEDGAPPLEPISKQWCGHSLPVCVDDNLILFWLIKEGR